MSKNSIKSVADYIERKSKRLKYWEADYEFGSNYPIAHNYNLNDIIKSISSNRKEGCYVFSSCKLVFWH